MATRYKLRSSREISDAALVVLGNTSNVNSGDQTSIVGISGTLAQFNTACSDDNFVSIGGAETVTGAKTFNDTKLLLRNAANTFNGSFTNANTADRIYTLPNAEGTVALTSDLSAYLPLAGGALTGPIEIDPTPASDLTASGITAIVTVDTNSVGVGSALVLAADGHYDEADADSATTMPCTAIALQTSTGSKTVLLKGFVRNDAWNWTPGSALYVSATVGTFTHTAPTTSGQQVQKIGYAYTADIIWFDPDLLIIEV